MDSIEQRARELLSEAFGCDVGELTMAEVRAARAILAWQAALAARPAGGEVVAVEGLRQGNWPHPDGGRIVGWVIEPEDADRMGADRMCLPREVADALTKLRNIHRSEVDHAALSAPPAAGAVPEGWRPMETAQREGQ